MEYTYNIINDVYEWMKSGKKDIEVRLLKDKSNSIQIGDYITFNNQDSPSRYIRVKVVDKDIYNSIDELVKNKDVNRMMPDHSIEELKELLIKIYGNGLDNGKLVAFTFKYIESD